MAPARPHSVPIAVIDTNIWLDLFVFDDPRARACGAAMRAGRLAALRSDAVDDEILRVMARETFRAWEAAPRLNEWRSLARRIEPDRHAPWRCSDPDDQKFLDLAVCGGARFLLTKDRALLRLAARARREGLSIQPPPLPDMP
jgi:putative PIN family toxin of toxin-antitoxin system